MRLFLNTLISATCSILADFFFKNSSVSLDATNSWLFLAGFLINTGYHLVLKQLFPEEPGFFEGLNWSVGLLILSNSVVGLLANAILKVPWYSLDGVNDMI